MKKSTLKNNPEENKKVEPKKKRDIKTGLASKNKSPERKKRYLNLNKVVFGRGACEVAKILSGKNKVSYSLNFDCGDYLTAYNLEKVKLKGNNKRSDKTYFRHSGYPGGIKSRTFMELQEKNYPELFRHAVLGMLPKNKLRKGMIKRLTVILGDLKNEIKKDKAK